MGKLEDARKNLRKYADIKKAKVLQGFFKTGPGEYAEGDIFLGVQVPNIRQVCNKFKNLSVKDLLSLLKSPIHEERLLAVFILINKYAKADEQEKEKIFDLYLKHVKFINNWDLVDLSAPAIVGGFLMDKDRQVLYKMAKSSLLWERRIAILATFAFIRANDFKDTFNITKLLLGDQEDLIHKACGWMLREAGKRDVRLEEKFLRKHCKIMPRTMLRYAIEKFPQLKRKLYL